MSPAWASGLTPATSGHAGPLSPLGARFEGVLRNWGPSWAPGEEGRLRDSAIFSVIAVEWPQVKSALTRRITIYATGSGPDSSGLTERIKQGTAE